MCVLKSDSLFENERFFASIPPFKFVFCSKCSVSKERINNFGRRASIFQNVHISRRESLTLKKTLWQIQLALENWRTGDLETLHSALEPLDSAPKITHPASCTMHSALCTGDLETLHWRFCILHWRPGDLETLHSALDTW